MLVVFYVLGELEIFWVCVKIFSCILIISTIIFKAGGWIPGLESAMVELFFWKMSANIFYNSVFLSYCSRSSRSENGKNASLDVWFFPFLGGALFSLLRLERGEEEKDS